MASSASSLASRRQFLRRAAALSGTVGSGALPFAMNLAAMNAASAQASDYKAIVCVFLHGGSDSVNMVLPTDPDSWAAYTSARGIGTDPIALSAAGAPADASAGPRSAAALGGVLPISPAFVASPDNASRSFALHPCMRSLQQLFGDGRLAVLPNVGPLVEPVTKAEIRAKAKRLPLKLGSHNDQQSTWQSLGPEGTRAGWGGRLGDLLASANQKVAFTSISTAGNAVFVAGQDVVQFHVGNGGAVPIAGTSGALFGSYTASAAYRSVLTHGDLPDLHGNLLAREHAVLAKRNIDMGVSFNDAYLAASVTPTTPYANPFTGAPATNPLTEQLRSVARIIGARDGLGVRRQVFFVGLGGFDTHDWQNSAQPDLMARLSHALAYFDTAMGAIGMREKVTLFTASDFGRTFASNGDGTDHGWGAHHLVMGGAVKGGDLYGRFPQLGNQADDSASGSFIPQTSVDQLGATLGRWFGATESQLDLVFPNLRNFQRDLGFMQAA